MLIIKGGYAPVMLYMQGVVIIPTRSLKESIVTLPDSLKKKYPGALAWSIGDNTDMANELAELVCRGIKTASCGSLAAYLADASAPKIGSYNIILNGQGEPVCVIRIVALRMLRFSEITEAFARKEGEGDFSLEYWKKEHKAFFTRAGTYSDNMELVTEEFEVIEIL